MRNLQESMEAMAFQRDLNYPTELKRLFNQLIDDRTRDDMEDTLKDIVELTFEVTGIWMEASVMTGQTSYFTPYVVDVEFPDFNAFSPINRKALKRIENYDLENLDISEFFNGTIDRKTGKVSGFFNQIKGHFRISDSFLQGAFEGDEIAGLYQHEVGHIWSYFELLGQTFSTNMILAEIVGRMDSQATIEKKYALGVAALKLAGSDVKPPLDVDSTTITALVLQGQVQRMQKSAGTRWYDVRLFETLADQYAARWMMGASLSKALAKIERGKGIFGQQGFEPRWFGLSVNFMNLVTLPFSSVSKGVSVVILKSVKSLATTYGATLAFNLFFFAIGDKTYNTVQQRIAAQRRELVGLLRDRTLPKALVETALADLKLIDEEQSKIHNVSDVISTLSDYTINFFTGVRDGVEREIEKEELANNRLYELSASLKG